MKTIIIIKDIECTNNLLRKLFINENNKHFLPFSLGNKLTLLKKKKQPLVNVEKIISLYVISIKAYEGKTELQIHNFATI